MIETKVRFKKGDRKQEKQDPGKSVKAGRRDATKKEGVGAGLQNCRSSTSVSSLA